MTATHQHHADPDDVADEPAVPPVVDRAAWQAARDQLLVREKAHTHEGDAIAAARRRLPMAEVDAGAVVVGRDGPTTLLDLFQGREELIVYKHMWHPGEPFENQCEGCTLTYWAVQDPAYLTARGVSFAVFAKAPYAELAPFVEFMGYPEHWYSVLDYSEQDGADGRGGGQWWCGSAVVTGVAPGRDHCAAGRPPDQLLPAPASSVRQNQPGTLPSGQPSGESCQASRRPRAVMSSSASAGIVASAPRPVTEFVRNTRSSWRRKHSQVPKSPLPSTSSVVSSTEYQCRGYPMNSTNGASSAYGAFATTANETPRAFRYAGSCTAK